MRYMKMNLGVWAFSALALLASCSDKDIVANVTIPEELEQAQTSGAGLDSHSYGISFEVKSDSEWKIELDEAGEEIAYVYPANGHGNATVKIYVLDNLTDEARQGTMTVVFPEDNSKNKVITLKQKAKSGSDDNFSAESVGNITYGVGYGFNVVTGVGARAIKSQIIKAQLLTEGNYVQKAPTSSASVEFNTYTGSTVKELSNNFSNTTEFSGSKWGIEAEANAKFDMNNYSKEEYQYAMSFVDVSKEQITITLNEDEWYEWDDMDEGCFTKAAYKAINGENRKYPSTNAGFKKLFDSYGTHVIRTATLGGRLTIATTINTSDISDEYNLDAFAKLSYSGVVDVSNEVKDEYKNSFKNNSSACNTRISALGGSSAIFSDLNDLIGDGAKNAANAWFTSLNEDEATWTFIGIDDMDNLIPLWDLVEDGERAEMMQEYFESGQYAADTYSGVSYEMGVQAVISEGLPEFNVFDTQIVDVKVGETNSKTVARICNEFIPELGEEAPVKVIYPVVNGNVKWNMGWFVGNENFSPRRVVNVNGKIKVETIQGENTVGEAEEIYIRGMRIATTPVDEETESQTTKFAPLYEKMVKQNKVDDYRVVKILDHIWLAENFAALQTTNGEKITIFNKTDKPQNPILNAYNRDDNLEGYYNDWYYYDYTVPATTYPEGWIQPNQDIMSAIVTMLEHYKIPVAGAFAIGGCLGFNGRDTGYYKWLYNGEKLNNYYDGAKNLFLVLEVRDGVKVDGSKRYETVVFQVNFETGTYKVGDIIENETEWFFGTTMIPYAMPVRLCKPIQ